MANQAWESALLKKLAEKGDLGKESVDYILQYNVKLNFKKYSESTGARWFLFKRITLNTHYYSTDTDLDDPKLLSLLVHEVHHLKQGTLTAFSVYGELDAWQVEHSFYKEIHPRKFSPAFEELLALPLNYDRENLRHAAKLMQDVAGKGYRIDLYPLYPIWDEIKYQVTRREKDSGREKNRLLEQGYFSDVLLVAELFYRCSSRRPRRRVVHGGAKKDYT